MPEPDELACAEMPAGSAVLYLGSTIHAGGEFHGGRLASRHAHELRRRLAAYRGEQLPQRAAGRRAHVAARSQELLGYAAHDAIASGGGYLGLVDLLDPVELLAQGKL
jgi:hypothetical protein